jgi:hypothetical protein
MQNVQAHSNSFSPLSNPNLLQIAKSIGIELEIEAMVDELVTSPRANNLVLAHDVEPDALPHTPSHLWGTVDLRGNQ